jgi:acyl-coenzyme A synthetase/AMP-(fatty) acid ligase
MLIIAGRNLPAEDVEWVVSSHETVRDGCCAAVADGNGGYIVVAEPSSIVPDSEIQQAQHDIRVLLTRQLSIAPTDVTFIERGGLPKTPSGKIQRWKLLELLNHLE